MMFRKKVRNLHLEMKSNLPTLIKCSLVAGTDDTLKPSQNPPTRGNSHRSLEEQYILAQKIEELKKIAENL